MDGEPTNQDRINRIAPTLQAYCKAKNEVYDELDTDCEITDLMADLMHFCAKRGYDFLKCFRMAETHFEAETDEEKPDNCTHDWSYSGTNYGGDDERYHGDGTVHCSKCGADGDA